MRAVHVILLFLLDVTSGYFEWSSSNDLNSIEERTTATAPSNLACYFCTQLLSVTKHRAGLSQNQLRAVLYEKCRVLSMMLKEQCVEFVETSLPEIYFSLNYDFSTKNICVRLNFCEERSSYETTSLTSNGTSTSTTSTMIPEREPAIGVAPAKATYRKKARRGRLSQRSHDVNIRNEERRLTCAFCERVLENAKNYAVTAKTDISSFASNACAKLPKGRYSDECYQLADKKITDLAKFVDQQHIAFRGDDVALSTLCNSYTPQNPTSQDLGRRERTAAWIERTSVGIKQVNTCGAPNSSLSVCRGSNSG